MSAAAIAVKERPILFSGPMVRAILEGKKSQTRRALAPQPDVSLDYANHGKRARREVVRFKCTGTVIKTGLDEWQADDASGQPINCFPDGKHSVKAELPCPYGQPGDRLWVRETWRERSATGFSEAHGEQDAEWYEYAADEAVTRDGDGKMVRAPHGARRWRPSIHMPREASRLTLEITEVRVERLQEISEADAIAEGIEPVKYEVQPGVYRRAFGILWDSLNTKRGYAWDANPWVWVISFRRGEP